MNEKENLELGELIVEITKGNTSAIGEIYKRVGATMLRSQKFIFAARQTPRTSFKIV